MEQQEILRILEGVAGGLGKLMGRDTEVVVHDLQNKEITYIYNGNITDREKGSRMPDSVYEMIMSQADDDDHMIAYSSTSAKGKHLRSSHIIIRNSEGMPAAIMCINQDTSHLEDMRNYLNYMLLTNGNGETADSTENMIQTVTQKAIMNSIWKMTSSDLDSKEGKIELLRDLKKQGIFDVKATTPYICKALSISQTTLYNYLREIKNEDEKAIRARKKIVE